LDPDPIPKWCGKERMSSTVQSRNRNIREFNGRGLDNEYEDGWKV
jgi:hypothetical protein